MDPITRMVAAGAAGVSGSSATYVDDLFSTFLYKGNADTSGSQTINNGIDLSSEGGFVWIKRRTAGNHILYDTERGATQALYTTTDVESARPGGLTSFNNNGFTVGNYTDENAEGQDVVAWTFRKAPGFFDIQTWTGDDSDSRQIAHNLDSTPGMILVKCTNDHTAHWHVYHRQNGQPGFDPASYGLFLNRDVQSDPSAAYWYNTAATSTDFTVGIVNNQAGKTYVAYIFAHDDARFGKNADESIIKCGRYNGGGSSETTIDLGFEPQWVIIKRENSGADWALYDNMRGVTTQKTSGDMELRPNQGSAETDENRIDFYAQGFKVQNDAAPTNGSGGRYVYMAIRRPHKPPTAGTDVFAVDTKTAASGSTPQYTSNFPVDLALRRNNINSQDNPEFIIRLTNGMQYSNNSGSESSGVTSAFALNFAYNTGFGDQPSVDSNDLLWMFRRAPGFMDVVAYNGSGTAGPIPHNLGAVPQMIIVKRRDSSTSWQHWYYSLGAGGLIQSAGTTPGGASTTAPHWNNTLPTATHFSVGTDNDVNYMYPSWWTDPPATYYAFLFGSLNGISKVGSYSGTGSDVDVDCGFGNGARFVMIKRSDGSGDFYIWDSLRGIVSGNDPYFILSSDAAAVTNTDYIDPLNAGFTVTSSAPAELNANGGTYLFLAIA